MKLESPTTNGNKSGGGFRSLCKVRCERPCMCIGFVREWYSCRLVQVNGSEFNKVKRTYVFIYACAKCA